MNRFFTFLLFILGVLTGCVDDELCIGTGTNIVKVKIFDYLDPNTPLAITFIGIEASVDPENLPAYADSTLTSINLTIDPNVEQTMFIFSTADRTDTLHTLYSILPRLISPTCGPEFLFNNLIVEEHTFDSLVVVETLIDSDVETNIQLYY